MPKFDFKLSLSVIIPLYNGAEWIESTLQHLLDQTVRPSEIIVVDDGSSDNGAQIVRQIAQANGDLIRLHRKANQGVGHTRNVGIQMSSGDLILLLDQDDLLQPEALEKHLEVWETEPTAQITRGNEKMVLVEGHSYPSWLKAETLDVVRIGTNFSSFVIHRSLFDTVGPLDESYSMGSDTDWFARAREKNVAFSPVEFLTTVRRIHGTNHSAQVTTAQVDLTTLLHASILRRRKEKSAAT